MAMLKLVRIVVVVCASWLSVDSARAMESETAVNLVSSPADWQISGAAVRQGADTETLVLQPLESKEGAVSIWRNLVAAAPKGSASFLTMETSSSAPLASLQGLVRIDYPHLKSPIIIKSAVTQQGRTTILTVPLYFPLDATRVLAWVRATGLSEKEQLSFSAKLVSADHSRRNEQIEEVIAEFQRRAFRADNINWSAVAALAAAMETRRNSSTGISDETLRFILTSLGDGHSYLIRSEPPAPPAVDPSSRPPTSAVLSAAHFSPKAFGAIQYLKLPSVLMDSGQAQSYAETLANAFRQRPEGACGWVVDLRGNFGGNLYPMLAGLKPLFSGGTQGCFLGKSERPWGYVDGKVGSGMLEVSTASADGIDLSYAPVAVLQDGSTASSAEALLMAFKRRPDTRSFGVTSAGMTTSNSVVIFDGKTIALSTSMMADSQRVTYPKGVPPDEVMSDADLRADPSHDSLRSALAWIDARCAAPVARQGAAAP